MTDNFEQPVDGVPPEEPRVVMNAQQQTVRIRRAPKFSALMIFGAIIGLVLALIFAIVFETPDGETTWQQVFGYLFLPSAAIGGALFGVLALWLDRSSRKHTSVVDAEQFHIKTESAAESADDTESV